MTADAVPISVYLAVSVRHRAGGVLRFDIGEKRNGDSLFSLGHLNMVLTVDINHQSSRRISAIHIRSTVLRGLVTATIDRGLDYPTKCLPGECR